MRWMMLVGLVFFGCDSDGASTNRADCIDPDGFDRDADDCIAGVYVTTNESGSFDADWLGDDTTLSEELTWNHGGSAVEVSIDVRRATAGESTVRVVDAADAVVGEYTVASGEPELEVFTDAGEGGVWTIVVELEGFSGAGDVSISGD